MWWKVLLIWLLFMVGAILNGTLRVKVIVPFTGEAIGHIISTVLLCAIILSITWYTLPWVGLGTTLQAWVIGACWLFLTLAFEFGFGHWVARKPWSELLADYNVLKGRVWPAVLLVILITPVVTGS